MIFHLEMFLYVVSYILPVGERNWN